MIQQIPNFAIITEGLPKCKAGEIDICVKYVFNQSGVLDIVGWVQGKGHISSALQVTDSAYEKHRIGAVVAPPALSRLAPEVNVASTIPPAFFVTPSDVPKDSEDRRIDEERLKQYTKLKDQKRKEKKEAKEKQKREKEERERELSISSRLHAHRASEASLERRLYVFFMDFFF